MNLTKAQRNKLKQLYGGHCAYCGIVLGPRWQADHFEPVKRYPEYKDVEEQGVLGGTYRHRVATGRVLMERPELDVWENLKPACTKCNNDKVDMTIEKWRAKLQRGPEVLARNYSTYRLSLTYGLLQVTNKPVVFFFETYRPRKRLMKGK